MLDQPLIVAKEFKLKGDLKIKISVTINPREGHSNVEKLADHSFRRSCGTFKYLYSPGIVGFRKLQNDAPTLLHLSYIFPTVPLINISDTPIHPTAPLINITDTPNATLINITDRSPSLE